MTGKITRHFSWEEFACRDGTPVPPAFRNNVIDLCVDVLEPVREAWASVVEVPGIEIVSGYRTLAHNTLVGGEDGSHHMTARAADIRPRRIQDVRRFYGLIFSLYVDGRLPRLGGLGSYGTWAHVDIAKPADGHLRRWAGGK